jgi:ribosome-binding factor A
MRPLRREKVQQAVREELGTVLQRELKDPRVGFVTVTRVEITPDGRIIKAYVSVLGNDQEIHNTMEGLKRAQGFLQKQVAQRLQLRYAPHLQILYDPSLAKSMDVQRLLKRLEDEEQEREAFHPPPDPDTDS